MNITTQPSRNLESAGFELLTREYKLPDERDMLRRACAELERGGIANVVRMVCDTKAELWREKKGMRKEAA